MKGTNDSTLTLAARLAAHLIVDAIELAKPGARLAARIGDRALSSIGRNPLIPRAFSEREAMEFLTMGGSERLDRAEEANEVLEPFWADGGPNEWLSDSPAARLISGITCPMCGTYTERDTKGLFNCPGCSVLLVVTTNSSNKSSAPVAHSPEPVAADAPGPKEAPSGVDQGQPTSAHGEQPASVGVTGPGAGEVAPGRAEHPLYRQIQEQADAAVVAEVLAAHTPRRATCANEVWCEELKRDGFNTECSHARFPDWRSWQAHVSAEIIQALQQ